MKQEKLSAEIKEIPFLTRGYFKIAIPENREPVIFLDYDGTLSPIVNNPDDAVLLPGMKEVIERCASKYTVAVVSGRDTDDVRDRVNIDKIVYAGSHGFSIKGPGNLSMEHEKASEILPILSEIEDKLHSIFSSGPVGVMVERKKYAITVHYRNADSLLTDEIKELTDKAVSGHSGIKKEKGKKIIEIKPDVEWNKGMAVKWILTKMGLWDNEKVLPIYVGDDITDEDAFRVLHGRGLGIIVGSHDNPTSADYRLEDVNEVKQFLNMLSEQAGI